MVVDAEGKKKTNKTTRRSEWRGALKKDLTGPAFLEMSGFPTKQDLASQNVPTSLLTRNNFRLVRDPGSIGGSGSSLPRTTFHPFREAKDGQGNNGYKTIEEFLPEAAD